MEPLLAGAIVLFLLLNVVLLLHIVVEVVRGCCELRTPRAGVAFTRALLLESVGVVRNSVGKLTGNCLAAVTQALIVAVEEPSASVVSNEATTYTLLGVETLHPSCHHVGVDRDKVLRNLRVTVSIVLVILTEILQSLSEVSPQFRPVYGA